MGNNLLISNFDRYFEDGREFVAVVYITERYNYTPVERGQGGYHETVLAQGNRTRVREAVVRALNYARDRGLRVQVNNPHVLEDMRTGFYDLAGLDVVGPTETPI